MEEPLITTEFEKAILRMTYDAPIEWDEKGIRNRFDDVVAAERELTRREARRVLDVLYDVNREFLHIELGLL